MGESILLDRRLVAFSQIGLRLVDDFTGQAPFGEVQAYLDIYNGGGNWHLTNAQSTKTPSGVFTYPKLEYHVDVTGLPVRRYRIRLKCKYYHPEYLVIKEGFEFDVFPFSDDSLPNLQPGALRNIVLLPASNYPYPHNISVLRGVVEDSAQTKLKNILVFHSILERVITDDRGLFGLPLRLGISPGPLTIDASDQRTGRTGSITVMYPDDLVQGVTITIS
jgi:hypothetical protein